MNDYDCRSPVHRALAGRADAWIDKPRPELAVRRKTADPPQCTGCERLTAENEPDTNNTACFTCTRLWPESGIKDFYKEQGPDEPENESEEV